MRVVNSLSASVMVAVLAAPVVAVAQTTPSQTVDPTNEARTHFDRGLVLFNQQDHVGALAEFQRAYDLSHRVSVLFNLGVTYQALHRYPQAASAIEEYLARAEGITPERRAAVEQALVEIRGFIAHVHLLVSPVGATVTLDGDPVPSALLGPSGVPVGPGEHVLEASAPGHDAVRRTIRIASGDVQDLQLDLPVTLVRGQGIPMSSMVLRGVPEGAWPTVDGRRVHLDEPQHLPAGVHRVSVTAAGLDPWTQDIELAPGVTRTVTTHMVSSHPSYPYLVLGGFIATGIFVVSSVVFGLLAESTHSEFEAHYQGDAQVSGLASRGNTERVLTNVSLVATGLAAVGTGVVLVLHRQSGHSTADIALSPSPEGLSGRLRLGF